MQFIPNPEPKSFKNHLKQTITINATIAFVMIGGVIANSLATGIYPTSWINLFSS